MHENLNFMLFKRKKEQVLNIFNFIVSKLSIICKCFYFKKIFLQEELNKSKQKYTKIK